MYDCVVGSVRPNSTEGRPPPTISARIDRPMNALQLCRGRVFRQRNFIADFLPEKCNFTRKTAVLRFWAPLGGGGLEATYDVHLRLIGKCVVDFLLALIELFC